MRKVPLALIVLFASVPACGCVGTWSDVPRPWTETTVRDEPRVEVTMRDGATFVLEAPSVTRQGEFLLLRGEAPEGRRYVAFDLVRSLRVERGSSFVGFAIGAHVLQGLGYLAAALRF